MYLPLFVLTQREKELLQEKLKRILVIKSFRVPINAYLVDEALYEQVVGFASNFGESLNENNERSRTNVIRAVTLVFNLMIEAQKIKDGDLKVATWASISSSIMSIMVMAPEYGERLISILKSKI